jgi:hypothetical protein
MTDPTRDRALDLTPPGELLDALLAGVDDHGLRTKAAQVGRGAVSGARKDYTALVAGTIAALAAACVIIARAGLRRRGR